MVHVLDADVIAKIAAGEVVDRPASVVKELIENSIDAKASRIEIHLKDAGKELIHIKDNGCGIAKVDLEKLFQRHATSKIKNIEDLDDLSSMGFRGEALFSIAAVSDIELRSQTKQGSASNEAWQIHIRGGQRLSLEPAPLSGVGTEIKIAELFFNTPARRKFLKANTSELNAIINVVLPYTLIYPEKSFLLTHAGRVILDLKPAQNACERMAAALNIDAHNLIDEAQEFSQDNVTVRLILGNINIQRPRRDLQYIFVNDRPVESKNLSFNLNDIYKLILPPGVYGAFVAQIHLNPANVDVNIHPTKREVRIKDEAKLISMIRRMAEYQLMEKGQVKRIGVMTNVNEGLPAADLIFAPGQLQGMFNPSTYVPSRQSEFSTASIQDNLVSPPIHLFNVEKSSLKERFSQSKYIGQWLNKFLLFEEGRSLLIVDQHAAQERIMFELFQDQINTGHVEVQPLLTPIVLRLTPQERVAWEDINLQLHELGIETTQFDEDSIAIQTQPVLLKNIERALRTLLNGDGIARADRNDIARRACKASIVSGDSVSPSQALYQRDQLLNCQTPFTCPHGRPTLIELPESFLDKNFLRT